MGNFNRDRRPGGGGHSSYGGSRSGGFGGRRDFNSAERQMFQTVCSKCGKECEVPFRPTGDRPVFCSDCFRESGGGESRRGERDNFSRPQFNRDESRGGGSQAPQFKEQLAEVNAKLDQILTLLTLAEGSQPEEEAAIVTPEKKKRAPKKSSEVVEE